MIRLVDGKAESQVCAGEECIHLYASKYQDFEAGSEMKAGGANMTRKQSLICFLLTFG